MFFAAAVGHQLVCEVNVLSVFAILKLRLERMNGTIFYNNIHKVSHNSAANS